MKKISNVLKKRNKSGAKTQPDSDVEECLLADFKDLARF